MPRTRSSRSRVRLPCTRNLSRRTLATILSLLLAAAGAALAQPASDLAALEARLQATEAELDAAADALRVLRDAAAQGKRFVVADRPPDAARSLGEALRYGQPLVVGTLEQAIAVITFYYLLGVTEATPFDAAVLADWVRRYLREEASVDQRVAWLETRVTELEHRRDDLRAALGGTDPSRDCIRLVRVDFRIQDLGGSDVRPDPILYLMGPVHTYRAPEARGLGVHRQLGYALEWTPPPAVICEGDRFTLHFSAINLGPSEVSSGTGARVNMTDPGGGPRFECSPDPMRAAHVSSTELGNDNVCVFAVHSLVSAQLEPRAQFTVTANSYTARGAVITYHYTR